MKFKELSIGEHFTFSLFRGNFSSVCKKISTRKYTFTTNTGKHTCEIGSINVEIDKALK
jgi:hypothetical protein